MPMISIPVRHPRSAFSIAALFIAAATVNPVTATAAPEDAPSAALDEVIVTGTRETGRKASESATPIEIISGATLQAIGQVDLRDALEQLSPAITRETFNTNSAALTDILALHGLSPNHLLVLVNGKRRHSTASVDTDGPQQGQTGVDIDTIPVSAIDHIEILRDGDSAQYGADAIAGVLNIILKSSDHGGAAQATAGAYYAGDGFSKQVSGDTGFSFNGKGFLHISGEYSGKEFTDRNGVDPRTGEHTNTFEGNPKNNTETVGINTGYSLTDDVELYGFATYAHRKGAGKELQRLPSFLPAVFPDGFQPFDTRLEDDYGITAGIRGKELFGWSWDVSSTFGRDTVNVGLINSVNPDFYTKYGYTPTDFHISTFDSSQWTNSLDLSRPVQIAFLPAPLTVSVGAEHRRDSYQIGAGDFASYYNGGPQALAGIAPADASDHSRNVVAAYLDLATKLTPQWQVDLAGRFEHYWGGIGSNATGKVSTRYDFSPQVAVRASFGTGFQPPSLAQEYFSSLVVGPTEAVGQLSPLGSIAKSLGATPLKPEESTNINFGFVLNPIEYLNVTVDIYQVVVRNRLIDSGYAEGAVAAAALAAGGIVLPSTATYISTNYLQNAADTRTRGADIAASYRTDLEQYGIVDWSISANINDTKLLRVATVDGAPVTNAQQDAWLTSVTPKYKIVLGGLWQKDKWGVSLHEHVYGHASDQATIYVGPNTFSTTVFDRFDERAKATTDLAVSYSFIHNLTLTLGANNLFNTYPDRFALQDQYLGWQYDGYISQMGINGGFYYGSLKYAF